LSQHERNTESLESEIERMWLVIVNSRAKREVWLTTSGRVISARDAAGYQFAELVGIYTDRVSLADLRSDVFHVWEGMRRG